MKINLYFYNSLTKKKEIFKPANQNKVNIYVCGVTVYDLCHLGHARGAVNFDLLRRLLEAIGYKVNFVKNYTDIDDKIIVQAHKKQITIDELTKKMIVEHDIDMASLFVKPPDIAPKATENVAEMIEMIDNLIKKGFAYKSQGDVFFRVATCQNYGNLSGKKLADLKAGARVEINEAKENSLDFVLWKKSKIGEPTWKSPWGEGRPGWHIECSCMCHKFIDGNLDIHGGGADLIFPHHENEIAQSESLFKKKLANYWLHNGMIQLEGKKMSKSLSNFITIRDLVISSNSTDLKKGFNPKVLRFFILQSSYRQKLNYSLDSLYDSCKVLDKIFNNLGSFFVLYKIDFIKFKYKCLTYSRTADIQDFLEILSNDLNTPKAIAKILEWNFDLVKKIKEQTKAEIFVKKIIRAIAILGLLDDDFLPQEWIYKRRKPIKKAIFKEIIAVINRIDLTTIAEVNFRESLKKVIEDANNLTEVIFYKLINYLIKERKQERVKLDWKKADCFRQELEKIEIKIKDIGNETEWHL